MAQVTEDEIVKLFGEQVERLQESHFLVLYWAAMGEGEKIKYNITNLFDDLKASGVTRTKQTVVGIVQALETIVRQKRYTGRKSAFLEAQEK